MAAVHLIGMTVSMRVISAGDGYRYLLRSVAAGDGDRDLGTPLTRYYTQTGTPPGRWLGAGLPGLSDDGPAAGEAVSEEHLRLLLGQGRDPVTGDPLGRAYPKYHAGDATRDGGERRRRAVAGYDYTFSVPKSVSALWAVADGATQARIAAAHHGAVADVVALLEREVAATRTGAAGPEGAVAQVAVHGVIATAFDHFDSRSGDPQLHTHVVISNKVQATHDGKWRALDGRPMHAATVALSEHYNAVLADRLTRELGVQWEQRARGRDRNPGWEIAGVPQRLLAEFSTRSRDVEAETRQLIDTYVARHGRRPSSTAVIKLRAQATLATRPDKQVRSLSDLTAQWRRRAARVLQTDATRWAQRLLEGARAAREGGNGPDAGVSQRPEDNVLMHADQLSDEDITALAKRALAVVGEKRSTWRRWNLHAEASRQTMHLRFATADDRDTAVGAITDAAEHASVRLTPPEVASSPTTFRRADGTSIFRPRYSDVFTSADLLAAEDRLLELGRDDSGPGMDAELLELLMRRNRRWRKLGRDQKAAVKEIAASGRVLDVLVGPAGTGKTTTMRTLRQAWERRYGAGSVLGLASSAAAADVLAGELGIAAENTAKWLWEHRRGRWDLRPDQLVIVDEASLAGTHTLDTIATHAATAGAKVLLVGDPHQLDAVEAGGAFSLLVDDRHHSGVTVPELTDVRRFHHRWEQDASLRLRDGDITVVEDYLDHDRIRDGDTSTMTDAIYTAWKHDIDQGRSSLMIAETREAVTELNLRARTDQLAAGRTQRGQQVRLSDRTDASVGDVVITRRNDRRLQAGRSWVRNGDRWQITHIRDGGSVRARRLGQGDRLGASTVLPAAYVASHLELGYAATIHRAQGTTVDTAHLLVASPAMTREAFYVAMTRGRSSNTAYVATDHPDLEQHQRQPDQSATARGILSGILNHPGRDFSAHQTARTEQERWSSIGQLAAEYDTLASEAQKPRWARLLLNAGLDRRQTAQVLASDAYGALAAKLRRAEADGHHLARILAAVIARHQLDDADDPAAILHHRIQDATTRAAAISSGRPRRIPGRIAGLISEAAGPMTDELRRALDERRHLIEQRANTLLTAAIRNRQPWLRDLGEQPRDPQHRRTWLTHAATIAAYRDRYQITDPARSLGARTGSEAQQVAAHHAATAINHARQTANLDAARFHANTTPRNRGPRRPSPPGL